MLTDLTGEEDESPFNPSLIPSGVLLTLLTRNLPFFLIELACLRAPEDVDDMVITGCTIYAEEDI